MSYDLTTVSDADLHAAEVHRRARIRNAEISKDPYHHRRPVSGIVNRLDQDKVYRRSQAVAIQGVLVWLEYREYANAFGGKVLGVMLEIDGVEYRKDLHEAYCIDVEMGTWINYIRPHVEPFIRSAP